MASHPDTDRTETLIAFVRGKLPADEAADLGREIEQSPALAAEVALLRGVAAAVETEARQAAPGELGWARLSRALDAEPRRGTARWRPLWQLAAAAGLAVVIWQAVAVPLLPPAGDGYLPVSEQPAEAFVLEVAFAPDATEAEIRALLRDIGARVSDGPSAIGLWQLGFAGAAERDAGLERLRAAPFVESVQAD